jgi:hypothetical protein
MLREKEMIYCKSSAVAQCFVVYESGKQMYLEDIFTYI